MNTIKVVKQNALKASCYVCGHPAGRYRQRTKNNYAIIKCEEYGLEYTDTILSESNLNLFYANYKDIRADRKILELNAEEHLIMLKKYGWIKGSKNNRWGQVI